MDAKYELRRAGIADRMRDLKAGVFASVSEALTDEDARWAEESSPMTAEELDARYIAKCKELVDAGNRHGGHVKRFCFDLAGDYLITLLRARETDLVLARIADKYGPY